MTEEKKKQNISRKKIINSAIVLFANKGFESTSTREICKHAGVNLSLIPYYFGNKDGLYTSIIESIVNYGLSFLQDEINTANQLEGMSREDKIGLYKTLLEKYADFLYSENVPNSFVILMIKEQAVSHSKFSEMYSQKINILYKALRKILASILDKKADDKTIIFEVSSIIGQILSFKIVHKVTLSSLNQDLYTKDDIKRVRNIILSHIETSLKNLNLSGNPLLTV